MMQEIKLGSGEYIISSGVTNFDTPAIVIEKAEVPRPVGTKAELTPVSENAIVITFSNRDCALVVIEKIAQAILGQTGG